MLPDWDKAKEMARKLALIRPERRMIGWDFCLTEDKGWVIIEGNITPGLVLQQVCDRVGKKAALDALLKE